MLKINKGSSYLLFAMSRLKILYASSSVGLGHVTRDVHLAKYLDWADIQWITAGQALRYLESRGLDILSVSHDLYELGSLLRPFFRDGWIKIDLGDMRKLYNSIQENAKKVSDAVDFDNYDIVIADEFWEILLLKDIGVKNIFITDFIRFKPIGNSLLQRIILPIINRMILSRIMSFDVRIYVGFDWRNYKGFEYYGQIYTHEEYIEPFEDDYVLVNIGGTDIGRPVRDKVVSILEDLDINYRVIGGKDFFSPNPVKTIAGARLVITLGGYGSLLELARFRKRGIIIPLGNHFEQEDNAKVFEGRRGYRVLTLDRLDKDTIAKYISEVLDEEPQPPEFRDAAGDIIARIRNMLGY